MKLKKSAAASLTALIVLAGCDLGDSVEDQMAEQATNQPGDTASSAGEEATPESESPSSDEVLPLGTVATVGDWDVAVTSITRNDAVQPYEPEPDTTYAGYLVRLEGTYNGDETGDMTFGLSLKYVGSDNRVYADFDSYMTDFEQDTVNTPEVVAGGTQTSDFTLAVPEGATGNPSIGVEPLFSLGDDFALWQFTA